MEISNYFQPVAGCVSVRLKSAVDLGLGLSTKKYFLPYCKIYRILNLIFSYCNSEIPYSKNMTQYYVGTIR